MYVLLAARTTLMHAHVHSNSGAGIAPVDREGGNASPSDGSGRRRLLPLRITALKPVTYSIMHLLVAISVAYALTRDWRIALGVGVIEPMVQTVAYMLHEKAWSRGARRQPLPALVDPIP
jgi:uncharacterized membrane protein